MRPMWKAILWQLLGVLCYLAGMLLFLVIMVDVYFSPPANSIENLSSSHLPLFAVSLVLLVLGRYVSYRFGSAVDLGAFGTGGYQSPSHPQSPNESQSKAQSVLQQHGYRDPSADAETDDPPYEYEDGDVYVTCPECGTRNEQGFEYCENCAAQLPE